MGVIAIPSNGPADWQRVLAKPDLHWKPGASAMTLAASWEAANGALPPEIAHVLDASGFPDLVNLKPLIIIPEFKVALPGGARASQTDVFVLAKGESSLVPIAVEGKVEEPFGPELAEKYRSGSPGQLERLEFLCKKLGVINLPMDVRYQLLHRTVSALLLAEQFGASSALMVVHSFSASDRWFADFARFAELLGASVRPNSVALLPSVSSRRLYVAWCSGNLDYTEIDLRRGAG